MGQTQTKKRREREGRKGKLKDILNFWHFTRKYPKLQLETANEKSFFYTIPIFSKLVKHVPFSRLDITNKYYDTNVQCKLFERRSVALRYHGSKISRSQQPFMTETAQAKEEKYY